MTDLPKSVTIVEQGPREGFQIEKGPITTDQKVALIDALSDTGLKTIQVASFVNPARVPGWADAEQVVARMKKRDGVRYTAASLNLKGLERVVATGRLDLDGHFSTCASEPFMIRNQNQDFARNTQMMRDSVQFCKDHGVKTFRAGVMAAFGCNFAGDISNEDVMAAFDRAFVVADELDVKIRGLCVYDTMAWGTPGSVKRVIGALRDRWPDLPVTIHLHDTRGLGLANAYAALEMGVREFDTGVGGLGGCPFAGHAAAAGNISTEDFVFMCHEMGIETGLDLEKLAECGRLAEEIVGHPLPGAVMHGGTLDALRSKIAA